MTTNNVSWYHHYHAKIHPSIEFRNGIYGYSGYATTDIVQDGTVELLSLPYTSILNEDYAIQESSIGRLIWHDIRLQEQYPIEVTPRMIMYLVMIYERSIVLGDTKVVDVKNSSNNISTNCNTVGGNNTSSSTSTSSLSPSSISKFGPYLRSLPIHYDDPTVWTTDELLTLLGGTNLYYGALHRTEWLHRIYKVFFPFLFEHYPTIFVPSVFTFDAFRWAHCAFSSRGFPDILSKSPVVVSVSSSSSNSSSLTSATTAETSTATSVSTSIDPLVDPDINPYQTNSDEPIGCMLPVLDILNHAPKTLVQWIRYKDRISFIAGNPTATVTSIHPSTVSSSSSPSSTAIPIIPKGHEIFNNYGPKSNEELCLAFGFVIPDNEFDTLSLVIGTSTSTTTNPHAVRRTNVKDIATINCTSSFNPREPPPVTYWSDQLQLSKRFICRRLVYPSSSSRNANQTPTLTALQTCLPPSLLQFMRILSLSTEEHEYLYILSQQYPTEFTAALPLLFTEPLSLVHEERMLIQLRELIYRKLYTLFKHHSWLLPLERYPQLTNNELDQIENEANLSSSTVVDPSSITAISTSSVPPKEEPCIIGPGMVYGASSEYITAKQTLTIPDNINIKEDNTTSLLTSSSSTTPITIPSSTVEPSYHRYRRYMARTYIRGQYDVLVDILETIRYHFEALVTDPSVSNSTVNNTSLFLRSSSTETTISNRQSIYSWLNSSSQTSTSIIPSSSSSSSSFAAPLSSLVYRIEKDILPYIHTSLVTDSRKLYTSTNPSFALPLLRIPLSFCLYPLNRLPEFRTLQTYLSTIDGLQLTVPPSSSFIMNKYTTNDNANINGNTLHSQFLYLVIYILFIRGTLPEYTITIKESFNDMEDTRTTTVATGKKRRRQSGTLPDTQTNTSAPHHPPSSSHSSSSSVIYSSEFLLWRTIVQRYSKEYDTATLMTLIPSVIEYSTDFYKQLYTDIMKPLYQTYPDIFRKECFTKSLWIWGCTLVQSNSFFLSVPILIRESSATVIQRMKTSITKVCIPQLIMVPMFPFVPYKDIDYNTNSSSASAGKDSLATTDTINSIPHTSVPLLTKQIHQDLSQLTKDQQPGSRWDIEARSCTTPVSTLSSSTPLNTSTEDNESIECNERLHALPYDILLRDTTTTTPASVASMVGTVSTSETDTITTSNLVVPIQNNNNSVSSVQFSSVHLNIRNLCVPSSLGYTEEGCDNDWSQYISNAGLGPMGMEGIGMEEEIGHG